VKRLHLHNLGCAKNQIEGEMLAGWADSGGVRLTDDPYTAEIIVVNTCAFIEEAKSEAVDAILDAARLKTEGCCEKLYVSGCFPQRSRDGRSGELPEVDGFFGVNEWQKILAEITPERIDTGSNPFVQRHLSTPGHYAYLRIADGCNRGCTYCIIPSLRGSYRSRLPAEIIEEARTLASRGVRELMPVAQELNSYGHDLDLGSKNGPLIALLEELSGIEGIEWIRPLYLHPPACDRELLEYWASQPKLCRYLDLPIEHGSDRILKAMGRAGSRDQIRKIVRLARDLMVDVVIRTSVIVGFPGETEVDFEELLDFIREMRFERLGSFRYSPEEGTPAFDLTDQIPEPVRAERQAKLMAVQGEIATELNQAQIGEVCEVFVDSFEEESDYSIAHSRSELPELDGEILIPGRHPVGEKLQVVIEETSEHDQIARPLSSRMREARAK
jgi:ribosomal protein S12 methylthiotransferase